MSQKAAKRIQADWKLHLSYDKSDPNIENFYSSINGAVTDKGSMFYNKRQIDIFLLAMAIGKEQNNREKVTLHSDSIRRDALTEKEVWMMCSVVLAECSDLTALAEPREIFKICEEYANGGIQTLMALDKSGSNVGGQYEDFLTGVISVVAKPTDENI